MKVSTGAVLASLALAAATLLSALPASADGALGSPAATQVGTFGGIAYVQYDGVFEGLTSTGAYRVPYRVTAPTDRRLANGTVLVEPPHGAPGLGALNRYLGRE